jgi:hypothetical protein
MRTRGDAITVLLLATAVVLSLALGRQDERRVLARQWVGPSLQDVPLGGPPAFRSDGRAVLFFEQGGAQGRIQGAVVVGGDKIETVLVTRSDEGISRRTLYDDDSFLQAFSGKTARAPVVVDAISGATISSQLVINAVNERLQRWEDYVRRNAGNSGS